MEVRTYIRFMEICRFVLVSGIISLIYACSSSDKKIVHLSEISPSQHALLAITPSFSIRIAGNTLHKRYPQLSAGNVFPIIGILRVDGKAYRFMGGDSLRLTPLAPLSGDSVGWKGKYSFLFPGNGWEQKEYNDSLWNKGEGAFGPSKKYYYPAHTQWGGENIYVRRHIKVDNKDALRGRKVYVRYFCDNWIKLFCNGKYLLESGITRQTKCQLLTNMAIEQLVDGDNILAAYCRNTGGPGLLDFGLYVENKNYSDAEPAILKRMDVQATQTHFVFQCGDAELLVNFVSPSLSEKWDIAGCPVGFLYYEIRTESEKEHMVDILFDVDMEWMFGKREIDSCIEQGWQFIQCDNLYLAMTAGKTIFSCEDNHAILSQTLCAGNENRGVLLIGHDDGKDLQYNGENLLHIWKKDGKREVIEYMKSVGNRYEQFKEECDYLDYRWNRKAFEMSGDKMFAVHVLSAYRDFISSHRFVNSSDNKLFCFNDSLGNVKQAYKYFPILQFYNRIDWMKALLNPIFDYCKNTHWKKKYPPYDIGLYPIASKQVMKEDHAVEVTANMLIMTAMIVELEQDVSYADLHWRQLSTWAEFLQESMKRLTFPSEDLLDENDERVKCVLGLKAYYRMIQYRRGND